MADIPITVLMPVYNAEAYLPRTIASILNQTYQDFEFLIIDDGSTDNSPTILRSFEDSRIKIIRQENKGIAAALHLGIHLARGEYIARMDNDDESMPNRLKVQKNALDKHPEAVLAYGLHDLIDSQGNLISSRQGAGFSNSIAKWLLIWSNFMTHPTVMIRAKVLNDYHLNYLPEISGAEDFDLWNRLISVGEFFFIPQVLLRYRIHEKSMTRTKSESNQFQVYTSVIAKNFARYHVNISSETAKELAAISGGPRVNPLTYTYRELPNSLLPLYEDLLNKFLKKASIDGRELIPIQAQQLVRWARCLLHISKLSAIQLLIRAFQHQRTILFSRIFCLTLAVLLLLPKRLILQVNKKRTRPFV